MAERTSFNIDGVLFESDVKVLKDGNDNIIMVSVENVSISSETDKEKVIAALKTPSINYGAQDWEVTSCAIHFLLLPLGSFGWIWFIDWQKVLDALPLVVNDNP